MTLIHTLNDECVSIALETCHQALPQELLNFYLLRCPFAKSDKSASVSAQGINLADYGWQDTKLSRLMNWIQQEFTDQNGRCQIAFFASDSINNTASQIGINNQHPCLSHKRAALQIKNKISVSEEGQCSIRLQEAYATCLFRHLRNSIAHGNFYIHESDRILLIDSASKPNTSIDKTKITFGMVTTLEFLTNLMNVVENGEANLAKFDLETGPSKKNLYRIHLNREITIEQEQEAD